MKGVYLPTDIKLHQADMQSLSLLKIGRILTGCVRTYYVVLKSQNLKTQAAARNVHLVGFRGPYSNGLQVILGQITTA
jgi:hypothetical protein